MNANKLGSRRFSGSSPATIDAHVAQPAEYDELPELTDDMLVRCRVRKGGRPRAANPKRLISIRLSEDVIERRRASGPGWQTRMAEKLTRGAAK